MSASYELTIAELQPEGVLKLLILLNSWRDPRGKQVPKEEQQRYFIPHTGPTLTYIHGPYKIIVGSQTLDAEFYAPFSLDESKTVALGPPTNAPASLQRTVDFQ